MIKKYRFSLFLLASVLVIASLAAYHMQNRFNTYVTIYGTAPW